ncbi:MAG: type II secretion system F family protein [bacterium]
MARFKWDNLILFVEHLAVASKLQLPLDKSIGMMSREALDRGWAKTQESVSELVRLGSPLSEALENYPQYFPVSMRRLVRVGEEGNVLPRMLMGLSRYLQAARELQHRLQKCLIYPMVVWTLLLINLGILLVFVIPRFMSMFPSAHITPHPFSMYLINLGPSVLILSEGMLLFLAWLVIGYIGSDVEGRNGLSNWAGRVIRYVPFLGPLHRHAKAAEVCEVLGVLVEGGHSGREAVRIAKGVLDSVSLQMALDEVDTALAAGTSFTPQRQKTWIPQTSLWMISETGGHADLGQVLQRIAEYHRRQAELLSGIVREIMEPFLLFTVAVLGGMAVIALYMFFFQMSSGIRF